MKISTDAPLQVAFMPAQASQNFLNAEHKKVLGVLQFGQFEKLDLPTAVPLLQVRKPVLLNSSGLNEIWYSATPVQYATEATIQSDAPGLVHYAHNGSVLFGAVELPAPKGAMQTATEQAYQAIAACLKKSAYPHLIRTWNVLPNIHDDENGIERYRAFNQGRYRALQHHALPTTLGAPAASALGVVDGPLQIYFLAARQPAHSIENPRQVSAYRYPRDYGEIAPNFSRAVLWPSSAPSSAQPSYSDPVLSSDMLFISGTASIVGHQSVHIGNATEQTREVLRNLTELVKQAHMPAVQTLQDLLLKVYVRAGVDVTQVRAVLNEYAIPTPHYVVLQADICRPELLVEMEAVGLSTATSESQLSTDNIARAR